jgi:hypothetical protein
VVLPDLDGPSTITSAASSTCNWASSIALTTLSPAQYQRHTPGRSILVPAAPAWAPRSAAAPSPALAPGLS